jgi:polysaccharide biosynthesis protein PslH
MKKILFLTYNNPEKCDNGDKRYSWDILKALKYSSEYYVHVVAYYEEAIEKNNIYTKLEYLCDKVTYVPFVYKNLLSIGLSKYPAMIANRKTPQMIDKVIEVLSSENYDIVFVNMFRMAYLIEYIKNFNIDKIFIGHNVEHLLSRSTYKYSNNLGVRIAYYVDYLKTKYWEKRYLLQYDKITAICDADIESYKNLLGLKNVELLTPVVDCSDDFIMNNTNELIVCGAFTWTPKRLNLLKLLSNKSLELLLIKDSKLNIIGRALQKDIEIGNRIPNVYLSGEVESVEPYYQKAAVALIPELVGGGFKLKIAEAVHYHLPIVAIKGSVTDSKMLNGIHYIEVDSFEELISKGIELLNDIELKKYLIENSVKLFTIRYSIKAVNEQLANVIFN